MLILNIKKHCYWFIPTLFGHKTPKAIILNTKYGDDDWKQHSKSKPQYNQPAETSSNKTPRQRVSDTNIIVILKNSPSDVGVVADGTFL